MSIRFTHWGAGIVLSVIAHLGAGTILLAALRPDPVAEQSSPRSELEVEAYSLKRDKAQQRQPEAEVAPEAERGETALDPGAIPRSQASAVTAPSTTRLAEATAPADTLSSTQPSTSAIAAIADPPGDVLEVISEPQGDVLEAVSEPQGDVIEAVQTPTDDLTPKAPVSQSVSATANPAENLFAVASPEATALDATTPLVLATISTAPSAAELTEANLATPLTRPVMPNMETKQASTLVAASAVPVSQTGMALPEVAMPADTLATLTPPAASLPQAQTEVMVAMISDAPRETAPPLAVQADRVKATLAFPGGDSGVDPVSLAAFQSFMEPGDVTVSGDTLRDGVSALLAQVPCSRLQVAFEPETATLQINGHVPEDDLRAPVLAALGAQMGADIGLSDNILVLPRPQCGALSGIADVGLPQSTDQITNPLLIGNDAHARVFGFVKDDPLSFDITGPEYPSYIYVDFFDAGGNVIHIAPNDRKPLRQHEADAPYRIGTRTPSEQGLHMVIAPPYGQEIVVAFAASDPLYEGLRPIIEPAAPYLEWLKLRVTEAREKNPNFKGEWVYFFVSTSEG